MWIVFFLLDQVELFMMHLRTLQCMFETIRWNCSYLFAPFAYQLFGVCFFFRNDLTYLVLTFFLYFALLCFVPT